jgi:tetratricopeptide (TPR) repeat protein
MKTQERQTDKLAEGMQAFANNDYEQSVRLFSELLNIQPDHTVALLSRGSAHMRLKRLNAAEADFTRALQSVPKNARALHLRGLVREMQGNDTTALKDFDSAIALEPDYGAAYLSRSHLYAKMGRGKQAVEDRQMVVRLTQRNLEEFADENNVWHSDHMQVESMMETELER